MCSIYTGYARANHSIQCDVRPSQLHRSLLCNKKFRIDISHLKADFLQYSILPVHPPQKRVKMLDKVYELRKREREKNEKPREGGVLVFKVLSRCLCLANFNLFEVRLAKHLFLVPVELTSSYKCCLQKAVYQSHFIIYLNKYPRTSRFNMFVFLFCLCLSTD